MATYKVTATKLESSTKDFIVEANSKEEARAAVEKILENSEQWDHWQDLAGWLGDDWQYTNLDALDAEEYDEDGTLERRQP